MFRRCAPFLNHQVPEEVLAKVSSMRYSVFTPLTRKESEPIMASVSFSSFPSIDFSRLDMSTLTMPKIEMPRINTDAVTNAARDAGYITVGLAVLAVQKAQVRRQEFRRSLHDQVGNGTSQMAEIVDAVEAGLASFDARLVAMEAKLDGAVVGIEKRLPERAGAVIGQAHEAVKVVRNQVRTMVNPTV